MANYADKAPGVYVEEVASGGAPIAGVGTSTGGFIGLLPDGRTMPTNPASGDTYANTMIANSLVLEAGSNTNDDRRPVSAGGLPIRSKLRI